MADYDVKAELTLDAKKLTKETKKAEKEIKQFKKELDKAAASAKKVEKSAERAAAKVARDFERAKSRARSSLNAISGAFSGLGGRLRGSSLGIGRVVGGLTAMAGTYLGVRAVTNVLRDFVQYAGQANSTVETLTLSLGTIMSEVEGFSFGRARQEAHGLYREIQNIAIESPGTAQEVADVFTMAYGPMRNAGVAMNDILRMSQNTLSVAQALRIDLPQVGRDISMMASGVAGTDVKTFRLLRSMRMITESTREWNEMALEEPAQAAARLMDIFERLGGPAAEAFGSTWIGVTSAFSDIMQNFSRIFGGPAFVVVRDALRGVNDWLLRYRDNLENVMEYLGASVGNVLTDVIDRVHRVFTTIGENMDNIVIRIDSMIARVRELMPAMKAIAKGIVAVTVISKIVGPMFMAFGGALSAISGLSGLAGMLGIGGGAAAAGGGGAAAAAGGGALSAVIAAAGAALSWIIPIVIGVGAAIFTLGATVYATFQRVGSHIWAALEPVMADLRSAASDFWVLLVAAWEFIEPFLVVLGSMIATVIIPGLASLSGTLRGLGSTARVVAGILGWLTDRIVPPMHQFAINLLAASRAIADFISQLFRIIAEIVSSLGLNVPSLNMEQFSIAGGEPAEPGPAGSWWDQLQEAFRRPRATSEWGTTGTGGAPPERPSTNVDMRGSTINVRQEFRQANPDRIWLDFVEGMSREAVVRTQTSFVNPLTR